MQSMYGLHLMIDGYVKDADSLTSKNVLEMIDALVDGLGMKYLVRPSAGEVLLDRTKLDSDDDEGGTSYLCQITTSHIAVHTWPLRKAVMMDIFSCRDFDCVEALGIADRFLLFRDARTHTLKRGEPRKEVDRLSDRKRRS